MNEKCHQKFRTLDLTFVQELTFFPTVAKSSHKKHFQPVMSEAAVSECLQEFQKALFKLERKMQNMIFISTKPGKIIHLFISRAWSVELHYFFSKLRARKLNFHVIQE